MTNRRRRKHRHQWKGVEYKAEPKPCTFVLWWREVRRLGIRAFYRRPHHYVVSFGLSIALMYIGAHGPAEHVTAWMYAVLENVGSVLDVE